MWHRRLLRLLLPAASEEAIHANAFTAHVWRAQETHRHWLPLTVEHANMDLEDVGVAPPINLVPLRSEQRQIPPARRPNATPRSFSADINFY